MTTLHVAMEDEKEHLYFTRDSHWTTSQKELWSYYIYYIGNNGLSGFNLGPSQFQNLLFLTVYDPTAPPFSAPCESNGCVLLTLVASAIVSLYRIL
jgi:hypothetical protein